MLSRFTSFRPTLTPFGITSTWLAMDAHPNECGFDVCTWLDSERQRRWAKVVIGPTGCEKNAYGPVIGRPNFSLPEEWDAIDWARQYVYTV